MNVELRNGEGTRSLELPIRIDGGQGRQPGVVRDQNKCIIEMSVENCSSVGEKKEKDEIGHFQNLEILSFSSLYYCQENF